MDVPKLNKLCHPWTKRKSLLKCPTGSQVKPGITMSISEAASKGTVCTYLEQNIVCQLCTDNKHNAVHVVFSFFRFFPRLEYSHTLLESLHSGHNGICTSRMVTIHLPIKHELPPMNPSLTFIAAWLATGYWALVNRLVYSEEGCLIAWTGHCTVPKIYSLKQCQK